ncbi:MAG TPA: hypothetical protein EYP90_00995, partial [Chromatiaceae bacterium]|nr:hypothetical protein [Chromatiaceae bacterium]
MPENASIQPPTTKTDHHKHKRLVTLDSYQGRYLGFAALLILALMTIAWIGHNRIGNITEAQVHRLETRAAAGQTLQKALRQLRAIEEWLHNQLV